jgi:hypothetical protein
MNRAPWYMRQASDFAVRSARSASAINGALPPLLVDADENDAKARGGVAQLREAA